MLATRQLSPLVGVSVGVAHSGEAADVQALRDQGVNDEQIVEIVAHVALNLFTNYVNVALAVPVDFPAVRLRRPISPRSSLPECLSSSRG